MNADLNIPEQAYQLATEAVEAYGLVASSDAYDIASDAIRTAAPLIVAAELDRMASTPFEDGPWWALASSLRNRAKELRGEQS